MKKILIVIVMFLIILSGTKTANTFSLLNYFSGEYSVYTSLDNGGEGTNLGFCFMNSMPESQNVVGESIIVENLEVATAISVLKARVVQTEYLDDGTIVIYAFTSLINDRVEVSGKSVNIQIATKNERTVIGWPLILGSY